MWSREKEMVRFGRLGMGSQGPGGTLWPNTSLSPQPTHILPPAGADRAGSVGSVSTTASSLGLDFGF